MLGFSPIASAPVADAGGVQGTAAVDAFLPMFTASGTAVVLVRASGAASLPLFVAAAAAVVLVRAQGAASLPMFAPTAHAIVLVRAAGAARLPAFTAAGAVVTGPRRALREWDECPRPTSSTFTVC